MKQLVNKIDERIRLTGLEDEFCYYTEDKRYIAFLLPQGTCIWSANDWEIREQAEKASKPKGETLDFCTWLDAEICRRGYTASGLGRSMGLSTNWLWYILNGRRVLPERRYAALEEALGLPQGTIARKKKELG